MKRKERELSSGEEWLENAKQPEGRKAQPDAKPAAGGIRRRLAVLLLACSVALGTASAGAIVPSVRVEASTASSLKKKVDAIIKKQTKSTDSKKKKLKKLFQYAANTWGYNRATQQVSSENAKTYALTTLKTKKGSCYHFAAAYAYLAARATGYKVRIAVGTTKGFGTANQPHAWTEVKIGSTWYVCDVNLDKFGVEPKGEYSGTYCLVKRSKVKKTYYNYKNVKYINVTL